MRQSLQVTILGQQFHLRTDSPPEQVRRIAEFVEEQIHEVTASGRVADSLQAAVLALLNVSARYLQGESQEGGVSPESKECLRRMVRRIEQSLDESA